MIKVAFCTELFTPETGGVERHSYELVKRMKEDFDVEVFTTECDINIPDVKINKISPYTIKNPPNRDIKLGFLYMHKLYESLSKRTDIDIIFANGHMAMIPCSAVGKKINKPVVAQIHDIYDKDWKFMATGINKIIGPIFEKIILKAKYDYVLTVNEELASLLRDKYYQNSCAMHNGIDLKYIHSVKADKKNKNSILFVGRLVPQKNFRILLESFEELAKINKDIVLNVVGEGYLKKDYEKNVANSNILNGRVNFLGNIAKNGHDKVIKLMKESGVFVLPSKRESFGIVLLESMACKTPVIASDCAGPKDFIKHNENGILVESKNALTANLKELLENKELYKKLVDKGLETAEAHDWDRIYTGFKKVIYLNLFRD